MLVLTRKKNEQIVIRIGTETVVVRVLSAVGERARLGITAPPHVSVHREEVARRIPEFQEELDKLCGMVAT